MSQAVTAGRVVAQRPARRGVHPNKLALVAALLVLTVVFAAPFAWLLITALKDTAELNAFPIHWLPVQAEWNNFWRALTWIDYARYTRNSLLLATVYAVLVTGTSALVGFGFARLKGWARGPL